MPEAQILRMWQLVTSHAGRDAGQAYLVCGVGQDGFVSLANGERRRIESPKRKNARHIMMYDVYADDLVTKSTSGQTVRNADVRAALQRLMVETGLAAGAQQGPEQPAPSRQ